MLKTLIGKGNESLFNKNVEKSISQLKEEGIDSVFFYNWSSLDQCKFNFNILNKKNNTSLIETGAKHISSYIINLTTFFLMELIHSNQNLLLHQFKYNQQNKGNDIFPIIECIDFKGVIRQLKKSSVNTISIKLYYYLFETFNDFEKRENFLKYKDLLFKNLKIFSKDELAFHFTSLISYCVLKNSISKDKSLMDKELFSIYKIYLKEKLYVDNKREYFDESVYRNILVTSLRLKEFNCVMEFISHYSKFLQPSKLENLMNLSYAEYYYTLGYEKNSPEALEDSFKYLTKIKEESFIVKYDVKTIYLLLYYELNYLDEKIMMQLENYRKFLRRNVWVSDLKKKRLYRFLNLYEKLVNLRNGDPNIDPHDLYASILTSEGLTQYQWLLDKTQKIISEKGIKLRVG